MATHTHELHMQNNHFKVKTLCQLHVDRDSIFFIKIVFSKISNELRIVIFLPLQFLIATLIEDGCFVFGPLSYYMLSSLWEVLVTPEA